MKIFYRLRRGVKTAPISSFHRYTSGRRDVVIACAYIYTTLAPTKCKNDIIYIFEFASDGESWINRKLSYDQRLMDRQSICTHGCHGPEASSSIIILSFFLVQCGFYIYQTRAEAYAVSLS
jgi:hypothetical protein